MAREVERSSATKSDMTEVASPVGEEAVCVAENRENEKVTPGLALIPAFLNLSTVPSLSLVRTDKTLGGVS